MTIERLLPDMNVVLLNGSRRQRYTLGCERCIFNGLAAGAVSDKEHANEILYWASFNPSGRVDWSAGLCIRDRVGFRTDTDYLALLALTRMADLDLCAPLPSITDLLAGGCATPVADSLTGADRAYLKALYSADLGKNLNIERADIHEEMMRQIEGR